MHLHNSARKLKDREIRALLNFGAKSAAPVSTLIYLCATDDRYQQRPEKCSSFVIDKAIEKLLPDKKKRNFEKGTFEHQHCAPTSTHAYTKTLVRCRKFPRDPPCSLELPKVLLATLIAKVRVDTVLEVRVQMT
jgi:hypothetical protein